MIEGIPIMLRETLESDLELSREKWSLEYQSRYDLDKMDLKNDPELRDAYLLVKKYERHLKDGLFLEAGCGPSRLSCLLAKEGVKTVGLDFSLNALVLARRLFEREGIDGFFICGNILEMPFRNYLFSYIYTGGVLEHFKNTQKAANEIYRCLAYGGFTTNTVPYLSLSTFYKMLRWGNIPDIPTLRNFIELIETKILKGKRMRFGYEKSFSARKIKRVFMNAGFRNLEIGLFRTYYTLDWVHSKFLRKLITKIADSSTLFWPMIYVNAVKNGFDCKSIRGHSSSSD